MQSHSIPRRDSQDDAETDAKQQSDHGRIVVPAEVVGDDHPGPDSDINDDCGYYRTDYTGDDDTGGQGGDVVWKLGRHSADGRLLCGVVLETE